MVQCAMFDLFPHEMFACVCVCACMSGWLDDVELVCDIVGDWFSYCLL